MRKTHGVVIVGSGPTAFVSAREYVRRGFRVTIVTPSLINSRNESLENAVSDKKMILKDRFEQPWAYYRRAASQVSSENQVEVNETLAFGGFSNVWGAVSFLPPHIHKYLPFMDIEEISSILVDLEEFFNFTHTDSEVWKIHAQLNSTKVMISDTKVPQLKDQDFNNWNAALAWELLDQSLVDFVEGYVMRFEERKTGQVSLTVELSDGITTNFECNELFFAAGPFGNARVILNSQDKLRELFISDSNVSYRVYFDFRLKQRYGKYMNPSRIYLMQPDAESKGGVYIQFYPLSDQLIQAFKIKSLHKFLKLCARAFAPLVTLGITFRASADSKGILLQANTGKPLLASLFSKQKWVPKLRRSFTEVLTSGLVPTPFMTNEKVGSGLHSGAFLSVDPDSAKFGLCGDEISNWSHVHFLGSSNLASIPPGPITLLGLCQAIYVSRNVINRIEK